MAANDEAAVPDPRPNRYVVFSYSGDPQGHWDDRRIFMYAWTAADVIVQFRTQFPDAHYNPIRYIEPWRRERHGNWPVEQPLPPIR